MAYEPPDVAGVAQGDRPAGSQLTLSDDRGAAWGLGRLVFILFWAAGVLTVGVAVWKLVVAVNQPVGERLVTLFAGLLYIAAAVGLTHNGRRMRVLAWSSIAVSLAGPIILGLMGIGESLNTEVWSPWTDFGRQVWYVSLAIPLIGFVWLWWSNPRRIVEISEGMDRRRRDS